jgi:hypothetical protein
MIRTEMTMNTQHEHSLNGYRQQLDGRSIDEALMARTHARLLERLEAGEGAMWQEVIEAPLDAVWEAAAADASRFYRHLPDVLGAEQIVDRDHRHWRIEKELAGRFEHRVGQVLIDVPRSMICASDLDPHDQGTTGILPTIYSLSVHEHSTHAGWTVVALAAVTLGVYNPWLLPSLGQQLESIRGVLSPAQRVGVRVVHTTSERFAERLAVTGSVIR